MTLGYCTALVMEEAIYIQTTPESSHFNYDSGYNIPNYWIIMYKKIRVRTHVGCVHLTTS